MRLIFCLLLGLVIAQSTAAQEASEPRQAFHGLYRSRDAIEPVDIQSDRLGGKPQAFWSQVANYCDVKGPCEASKIRLAGYCPPKSNAPQCIQYNQSGEPIMVMGHYRPLYLLLSHFAAGSPATDLPMTFTIVGPVKGKSGIVLFAVRHGQPTCYFLYSRGDDPALECAEAAASEKAYSKHIGLLSVQ